MKLSKEFFAVVNTAIKNSQWKRSDFKLIESVEKELKLLYESQQLPSSQLKISEYAPQETQNHFETSPIDMMIAAGVEQAKRAPKEEAALLKKVKVDKMPESQKDYEKDEFEL